MSSRIPFGAPGELPPVEVKIPMDEFENAIRKCGVVTACEWFGWPHNSEFTRDAIKWLQEREEKAPHVPL